MENIFKKIPLRFVYMTMASSLLILALVSYLYLFKKPLTEYSALQQGKTLLQAKVSNKMRFSTDIEKLKNGVTQLTGRLYGENQPQSEQEMIANSIAKLDSISSNHEIQLLSVKPGTPRAISMFKVLSFDVEVEGRYAQLLKWLHQVEIQFDSMVVKQFEIVPIDNSKELHIILKIVSYLPS